MGMIRSAVVLIVAATSPCGVAQGGAANSPNLAAGAAASQGQAPAAKLPGWDVVSVRPADPQQCTQGAGMRTTTDGVSIFCVPLLFAIEQAYLIHEPSRILGAPEWVKNNSVKFVIDAKVAGEDVETYHHLSRDDHSRMLQPLLAERFHLKAHIEQREMPIYELVVAKGGSKLKESPEDAAGNAHMVTDGRGKIDVQHALLSGLPGILNSEVGRPVVDKTGLTGKYDFTLEYVPAAKAATDESGGPSIFTALEEQLGLKLEPAKVPMDVLVIDSIEQPAAN